ncbi:MAG: ATP-grasp domain-containing protein [Clostridia bacterium]|nr:ATP-grasp domain-containing protein [Clostridia bacterium]
MRILFTCVGRRVELVQAFYAAAKKCNEKLEIYATDMTMTAPAIAFCDKGFTAPRISDKGYIPFLLRLCKEEKIDAVIPTIDTDLLILAENKKAFEDIGVKVFVAAPEKVRICRDKRYTSEYFESLGLSAPKATGNIKNYTGGFPAFIKPKDGSSSIDAYKVENENDLKTYADKIGEYVVQPFISGKEYTVDIFCDENGNPIYITPRIRLAVRAGEVLKTEIKQDESIIEQMKTLAADFKPSGAITVQLIKDEKTDVNYYIEINPRFGGGAPLSIKAGADAAEALIRVVRGETLAFQKGAAEDGAIYSRFDQSVRVN